MYHVVLRLILLVGLFFSLFVLASGMSGWRLPDNQQGYAPKQPIEYSHRLHAGELQIDCLFCHSAAEHSRHAGIPSTDVCMKCHRFVTASFDVMSEKLRIEDQIKQLRERANAQSDDGDEATSLDDLQRQLGELKNPSTELEKLYSSLGIESPTEPVPSSVDSSIPWVRVHNLPDYVYFDHRAHVAAGVTCQRCHGPVESMERMRQFETLSMGWCVNCHRESTENGINGQAVQASIDCTVCHY